MNDPFIKRIGRVRPSEAGESLGAQYSFHPETGGPITAEQDKLARQVNTALDRKGALTKVSIHFHVDEETGQLVVFVMDRESRRVLRSIPASEFNKLKAGDLLKLTA